MKPKPLSGVESIYSEALHKLMEYRKLFTMLQDIYYLGAPVLHYPPRTSLA